MKDDNKDADPINAVDLRVMRHSVHANVHCCLCGAGPLDHPDLHNAAPLGPVDSDDEWGRSCCTECNNGKVIPARIKYMNKAQGAYREQLEGLLEDGSLKGTQNRNLHRIMWLRVISEAYDHLSPDQAIEAGTKVVKALEELVAQGAMGDYTAEELLASIRDEYPNLKLHFPKQEDKDGD